MPTLSVERDVLFAHMGQTFTDEEFDELCFEFGIELDEITSEREEAAKQQQSSDGGGGTSKKPESALSDKIIYKIDMPANRYDLLCVEGLSRALRIFQTEMDAPVYKLTKNPNEETAADDMIQMKVLVDHTRQIRQYVVCGILRDIRFDEHNYRSFIDLQDQLHRNLCRQRTLVAIGTHDLDTLQPPFLYDAKPPSEIEFVPLTPNHQSFRADALMEYYETDPTAKHLKPYVSIIRDSALYPVITDANDVVLSLPPIINGDHSKITLNTRNVFIECTATDITKANIVLDTVVTMFSEYCSKPFTIEPVRIEYVSHEDDHQPPVVVMTTPLLSTRRERANVAFCNSLIGINVAPEQMKHLCNRLQLGPAELVDNDETLVVTVPPTRSDILHAVDIAEDIGIAYGYNNIPKRIPATNTVGSECRINLVGDLLRDEIARAGYTEILTHGLCSLHDNFTALQRPTTAAAVQLSNPANVEYQVVRTSLLPGLLKTLQHNKSASFSNGFKVFEISDIVLVDTERWVCETIVGTRNVRTVAAVYAGPTSGFEIIHGLVDRIFTLLQIAPEPSFIANSMQKSSTSDENNLAVSREGWFYTIQEETQEPIRQDNDNENTNVDRMYFPGRAASIWVTTPGNNGSPQKIGSFGVLHPQVLHNFDIGYPASCVEIDLEALI
jgi:phenylalanyl-tRNA synthetase beta chain